MLGSMKNGRPVTPRKAVDFKALRAARVAAGISGCELAKRLRVNPQTFVGWESGRYRPDAKMAQAWAKAVRGLK